MRTKKIYTGENERMRFRKLVVENLAKYGATQRDRVLSRLISHAKADISILSVAMEIALSVEEAQIRSAVASENAAVSAAPEKVTSIDSKVYRTKPSTERLADLAKGVRASVCLASIYRCMNGKTLGEHTIGELKDLIETSTKQVNLYRAVYGLLSSKYANLPDSAKVGEYLDDAQFTAVLNDVGLKAPVAAKAAA